MATTYNLAPNPVWQFTDFAALYLSNGEMYTWEDLERTVPKPVYKDPEGMTAWPNPLIFGDPTGSAYPIYWASDSNYYVEIYDQFGNLQYVFSDFNAPGFGPNPSPDSPPINKNFILDGQFRFPVSLSQSLTLGAYLSPQCLFNQGPTGQVNNFVFNRFLPGQTQVPSNPIYYLSSSCTAPASASSSRIEFYIGDSNTFETYDIAFGFWARSAFGSAVSITAVQYFGSGGSPSPTVGTVIFSATLTPDWAFYQGTITIPSISGKTLGTNNDDTFSIWISYPSGTIYQVDQTNIQCQLGTTITNYDYLSYNQDRSEVYGQKLPVPAYGIPSPDTGKYVTLGAETTGESPGFQQQAFVLTTLSLYYGVSTGTNTYAVTMTSPSITAYEAGRIYNIAIGATNTGASTLNINSIGAVPIALFGAIPLSFGNLVAGMTAQLIFDGMRFLLMNPSEPAFYVQTYKATNQTILNATTADVIFDGVVSDTSGFYNPGNGRFTPTYPCRVSASSNVNFIPNSPVTGPGIRVSVSKNGGEVYSGDSTNQAGASALSQNTSAWISLNGLGDYMTIRMVNDTGFDGNVTNQAILSWMTLFAI